MCYNREGNGPHTPDAAAESGPEGEHVLSWERFALRLELDIAPLYIPRRLRVWDEYGARRGDGIAAVVGTEPVLQPAVNRATAAVS